MNRLSTVAKHQTKNRNLRLKDRSSLSRMRLSSACKFSGASIDHSNVRRFMMLHLLGIAVNTIAYLSKWKKRVESGYLLIQATLVQRLEPCVVPISNDIYSTYINDTKRPSWRNSKINADGSSRYLATLFVWVGDSLSEEESDTKEKEEAIRESHIKRDKMKHLIGKSKTSNPFDAPTPMPKLLDHKTLFGHRQSNAEARQVDKIGSQIKALRKAHGYSRSVLAKIIDVDLELLVALENGYGDIATAENIFEKVTTSLKY